MELAIDTIMVFAVLSNLLLLGSSRLAACIRVIAVQGVILGVLPLVSHESDTAAATLLPAGGSILLKGVIFPRLLTRAVQEAQIRREVEPYVGYTVSLGAGVLFLALSFWLAARLPLPPSGSGSFVVAAAMSMIMSGLFLVVSRKKAISQVIGYLVMENGIYAFGVAMVREQPWLVELGVLLDIFVAVFVMGITIFHINREFDHIDTDRLAALKDWPS